MFLPSHESTSDRNSQICNTSTPIKKRPPPITPYLQHTQPALPGLINGAQQAIEQATSFETTVSDAPQVFSQNQAGADTNSATTSIQHRDGDSQDYFPSQFAEEVLQDKDIQKSFVSLGDELSYASNRYSAGVSTTTTTTKMTISSIPEIQADDPSGPPQLADFKELLCKHNPFKAFQFATVSEWRDRAGLCEDKINSITQSGSLNWNLSERQDGCPLTFQQPQLRLELSCRFHRKFGSDRFMIVHLPHFLTLSRSRFQGLDVEGIRNAVASWLAQETHRFLGRKWKAFYMELSKSSKGKEKIAPRHKVYFFAESGQGISEKVSLRQFLQWHMSIVDNINSTDCKIFQRFLLGLSKTTPTVILEQQEFARPECKTRIMNDGCARMSETLARKICGDLGLVSVPSVFQGRIAGAKGVWMVEKDDQCPFLSPRRFYIEVTEDSQLKIKPHPALVANLDEHQRTFEVIGYAKTPRVADLNARLLTILSDRGVPQPTLVKYLLKEISEIYDDLQDAGANPLLLRAWISTAEIITRDRGIDFAGSWPSRWVEQAILLLESGFEPNTCVPLIDVIRKLLRSRLSRNVEGFKIKVPLSTIVYCIADPYGVLAEDEVHLRFSMAWEDESSGFNETELDGFDVLVARSPAFLPSDVQRRKARCKSELRHFRDVIVFPTTGQRPLASLLSGGDYDGDKVWVCWDKMLVEPFQNSEPPDHEPSREDCSIQSVATKLVSIFKVRNGKIRKREVKSLFQNCFSFNLKPSFLGQSSNEFDKLTYHENTISSPHAVLLATIAGYMVDAAKAGSWLPASSWEGILKRVSPKARCIPAYKDPNATKSSAKQSNILDYLTFWIALPQRDRLLTEYHHKWKHITDNPPKDPDLTQLWAQTVTRSQNETRDKNRELKKLTDKLWNDIQTVHTHWSASSSNSIPSPSKNSRRSLSQEDTEASPTILTKAREIHKFLHTSVTPPEIQHYIYDRYLSEPLENIPAHATHWSLVRASCLYERFDLGLFAWNIAGLELCEMKRRAVASRVGSGRSGGGVVGGGVRAMLESFYLNTKFDGRAVRRLHARMQGGSLATTTTAAVAGVDMVMGDEEDVDSWDHESELWVEVEAGASDDNDEDLDAALAELDYIQTG